MPKKTWNILSFSDGMNAKKTEKDIDPKGFEFSNNYISFTDGSIASKGLFDTIEGFNLKEGGFQENLSFQGTPNLYKVFPEIGFRKFGKAQYDSSSASWKELDSNSSTGTVHHGLEVGISVLIIDSGDNVVSSGGRNESLIAKKGIVTEVVDFNSFKIDVTGMANGNEIFYAINADYNVKEVLKSDPSSSYYENKYLLTSQDRKFGFYNIGQNKSWFGKVNGTNTNVFGNNCWFLDSRYLWDTQQHSRYDSTYQYIVNTKINNAYYETSAFRLLPEAPLEYYNGRCVRPFGLYAIEREQHRFAENAYVIYPGWYALRSHILSPSEYHRTQEEDTADITNYGNDINYNLEYYQGAGTVNINATPKYTFDDLAANAGNPTGPSNYPNSGPTTPFQVSMSVSHGQGTSGDALGDWQFQSGDTHSYLKFGMSYLYDNIEDEFAVESNISPLTMPDGTEGWVNMTQGSPSADKALIMSWFFYVGENSYTENQSLMFNSFEGDVPEAKAVAEFRGSGMNNGFSNDKCLNPRIVGARIYLLGDYANYDGEGYNEYEEPLYLAKIDFSANKTGKSHDNFVSTSWANSSSSADGVYGQKIVIPGVPVLTYPLINTYNHNENIHVWYKSSAIVNRKLYAGNVHYFDKNQPNWETHKPIHKPDRILVSPPNKFDVLPSTNYLDVMQGDGQDITHIESLNNKLLVYKNDDMFLIDCSGEFEILEATNINAGVTNSTKVTKTPEAVYWVNSSGVWGYDIENPILNIVEEKFDAEKWHSQVYSDECYLTYEPKSKMLLLFTQFKGDHITTTDDPTNVLYISTITGSVFFKTELAKNHLNQIPIGATVADNFLYTSISDTTTSDLGYLHLNHATTGVVGEKQSGMWEFRIVQDGSYDYQFPDNSIKKLSVRYRGGEANEYDNWDEVNTNNLTVPRIAAVDTTNEAEVLAATEAQIIHFNEMVNDATETETHPTSGSEYADIFNWTLERELEISAGIYYVTYYLSMEANEYTSTNNLVDADSGVKLPGAQESLSVYGTTCVGFTDGTGANGIRNTPNSLTLFNQIFHNPGVTPVADVWNVFINRNNDYDAGESFNIIYQINGGAVNNNIVSYTTDPANDDCNVIGASAGGGATYTNAYNSKKATAALRDALLADSDFLLYFDIGSLVTGDQTAVTGLPGDNDGTGLVHYEYFTITSKASTYPDSTFNISWGSSSHLGGNLHRFNPTAEHSTGNMLITKNIDFKMPGVRKKVYKAYVSYKTGTGNTITAQYMINGDGTWHTAVLKNSSNQIVSEVPASAEWSRFSIEDNDTNRTNSIYSIQYKIEGSGYIEIDDMSIIYRDKPPR